MKDEQVEQITRAIFEFGQEICSSLNRISIGDNNGPTGLESVTMALKGKGDNWDENVTSGLNNIASALREVADAIRESKQS